MVDHWFEWKYHIDSTEHIPDPTAFLDDTMKIIVSDKNYLADNFTLIGDTPNQKNDNDKIESLRAFLHKNIMSKYLPLTDATVNPSVDIIVEPPKRRAKTSKSSPLILSNKIHLEGKNYYSKLDGDNCLEILRSFQSQF